MLFELKEFEHFFSAAVLRKGWTLFTANKIEVLPEIKGGKRRFTVASEVLEVQRRGDVVLSYHCSCERAYLCEHLAALAFFLQKDIFPQKSSTRKKHNEQGPLANFRLALAAVRNKPLKEFFANSPPNEALVRKYFSDPGAGHLELYALFWKQLFQPYLQKELLTQKHLDGILNEIRRQQKAHHQARKPENTSLFNLSCLIEGVSLSALRNSGDETALPHLWRDLKTQLDGRFQKGLSKEEKLFWVQALLLFLRESKHFYPDLSLFLLPRTLQLSKSRSFYAELTTLLEQKNYQQHYGEPFHFLRISKCMVYLQRKKLFKEALPSLYERDELECLLAQTELLASQSKINKVMHLLVKTYESWSPAQKARQSNFRDYALNKAREGEDKAMELYFLKESLVFDLYIHPEKLKATLRLIPAHNKRAEVDALIQRIRQTNSELAQDKVNTLLLETQRLDELVKELKKQNNSFLLLHKVLVQKWPQYTNFDLEVYLQQLMQAFSNRRVFHKPEDLFSFAMTFLHKLPARDREKMKEGILSKLGGKSLLHQFVSDLFAEKQTNPPA